MTVRKRVLLVGKGAPERGGVPTYIAMLQSGPLAERYDVSFLNLARAGSREGGRLSRSNVGRALADATAVWRAAGSCDVVHIHSALAPGVTMLRAGLLAAAGRARGCRVVVHGHGGRIQLWLTSPIRRLFARVALWPASHVVTVSSAGHDRLAAALGAARVTLVDNGVDTAVFVPSKADNESPRVVYVGLLTPRKGVIDLLMASAELTSRGVRHDLQLVGGEPDEGGGGEEEVRAAAPDPRVFVGSRSHDAMPAIYAGADVFCLPSWWEAMSLSVLEAMASGRPVVATDVGDIARAVDHGVTGLVVPPRNPHALADALERLLTHPAVRADMGAAGRARVEQHFSSETMVDALQRIYEGT